MSRSPRPGPMPGRRWTRSGTPTRRSPSASSTIQRRPRSACPRKIHGPSEQGPMPGQRDWLFPDWLDFPGRPSRIPPKDARYGSPLHLHVSRAGSGTLAVQVIAFVARDLPDLETSRAVLKDVLHHLREDLGQRARQGGPRPTGSPPGTAPRGPSERASNTPARVRVLGPNAKGTGFRVQEEGKPEGSLTVGKRPDPTPAEGDVVEVLIHDDVPDRPQYKSARPIGQGEIIPAAARPTPTASPVIHPQPDRRSRACVSCSACCPTSTSRTCSRSTTSSPIGWC